MVALSLDSRSARFFSQAWIGWHPENRYYFDNTNIQLLLWRYGFSSVWLSKDLRIYTLAHINQRATGFPKTWVTRLIRLFYNILPSFLHNLYFRLPSSGIIVVAKKVERRKQPLLSIVLPVYNECSTFPILMEQLVAKPIKGADKEIIIVESNSTDNTRQLVMQYKDQTGIKIILQDKALGKGNAVREGFEHARGDIVLIQDADLEYDPDEYVNLLKPILDGKADVGRWRVRYR